MTLAGVLSDEAFHKCAACIRELESKGKVTSTQLQFFATQWDQYLKKLQNNLKGEFYQHKGSPIVILNGSQYIGGEEQFLEWALQEFRYTDRTSALIYKKIASDTHRNAINNTPGRSYVYMKINTGANVAQKIVIELFDDICPKTCDNFRQLCEGYKPEGGNSVGYAGTEFHRVVKGMYVQGGDMFKSFGK